METNPKNQRQHFYRDYASGQWPMSELCDRYQISRPTGYKWIDRIEAEGLKAVEGSGACAPFFPDLEGRVRAGSGTESQRFPRQFRSCSLRERRLSKGGRIGHFGNAIAARHGIASGFSITPRLGRCAGSQLECPIPRHGEVSRLIRGGQLVAVQRGVATRALIGSSAASPRNQSNGPDRGRMQSKQTGFGNL